MPVFFFNLQDGKGGIEDEEGVDLPTLVAAQEHAIGVARELMRRNEPKWRICRLDILNSEGSLLFTLPFAKVDPLLDHLDQPLREVVERLSESRRNLADTLSDMKRLRFQLRGARSRAQHKPCLVTLNGKKI
jgi:hypothetical protein